MLRMLLSGLTHKVILSHAALDHLTRDCCHLPSVWCRPASTKHQVSPPQTHAQASLMWASLIWELPQRRLPPQTNPGYSRLTRKTKQDKVQHEEKSVQNQAMCDGSRNPAAKFKPVKIDSTGDSFQDFQKYIHSFDANSSHIRKTCYIDLCHN